MKCPETHLNRFHILQALDIPYFSHSPISPLHELAEIPTIEEFIPANAAGFEENVKIHDNELIKLSKKKVCLNGLFVLTLTLRKKTTYSTPLPSLATKFPIVT
jgi:hypothetical protein